ncbi:hypothetical protein B0H13DRAFT_1851814 [Mycena leptocephala]|nr:hypothetical protein B0H13DRAFT_1851814 [Mycena leptocephala]
MSLPAKAKYGHLSWTESLGMVATLIPLPAVLLWSVATTAYASYNKERSVKRIVGDSALRHIISRLNIPQLQNAFGTTLGTYEKWTKTAKLPATVDELEEDARLLWIGPKRLERVILRWLSTARLGYRMSFWRYVQLELERQNIEVGIALLNYCTPILPLAHELILVSTVTDSILPHPAQAGGLALDFLMAAGVKPQNLQLAGDSAGGNLILQVLSQILHPRKAVPEIRLPAPKSHTENEGRDFLSKDALAQWGAQILAAVPETDRMFVETVRAPEWWFKGADALVDRMLITAGGAELLRDDIVVVGEAFKKHHPNVELVVQKDGLHEDMYLDFVLGEKKLGSLTPLTVEWLAAGFTAEPM